MERIELIKKLDGNYYDVRTTVAIKSLIEMILNGDSTEEEKAYLSLLEMKGLIRLKK